MLQDVLKKGQGKGEISLLGNVGAGVKIFVPILVNLCSLLLSVL